MSTICGSLYRAPLFVVGSKQYAVEETAVQKSMDRVHELLEEDPKYTQWGDLDGETGYYLSVRIDGTLYSVRYLVLLASIAYGHCTHSS